MVRLAARTRTSIADRLNTQVGLKTTVSVLTILTLSLGLLTAAARSVSAVVRHIDQQTAIWQRIVVIDSSLKRMDAKLRRMEYDWERAKDSR